MSSRFLAKPGDFVMQPRSTSPEWDAWTVETPDGRCHWASGGLIVSENREIVLQKLADVMATGSSIQVLPNCPAVSTGDLSNPKLWLASLMRVYGPEGEYPDALAEELAPGHPEGTVS